jgi:hypothetical protein
MPTTAPPTTKMMSMPTASQQLAMAPDVAGMKEFAEKVGRPTAPPEASTAMPGTQGIAADLKGFSRSSTPIIAPPPAPLTIQGQKVNADGASITGRGGNVQQLGAAAQKKLAAGTKALAAAKADPQFVDKRGSPARSGAPFKDGARSASTGSEEAIKSFAAQNPGLTEGFIRNAARPTPPPTIQGRALNADGASITGANGGTQQLGAAALRRLGGVAGGGAPAPVPPPAAPPDAEMANKLRGFKLATAVNSAPPGGGFEGGLMSPDPNDPRARAFIERLGGGGGGMPGTGPEAVGDGMTAAVNARQDLAGALDTYERGPQAMGNDMPGDHPAGAAGLFDSLGRVGAGLPPNGGVRPRPMPFNRPSAALGGL